MLQYNRIPIWENRRRAVALRRFRQLILAYGGNITFPNWMAGTTTPIETSSALAARSELNFMLEDASEIVKAAGVITVLLYTSPPAAGGLIHRVSVFENLFGLHQFRIPYDQVIDYVDRAAGVYERDRRRSLLRTFNPLYWLGRLFDFIASAPFRIASRAGSIRRASRTQFQVGSSNSLSICWKDSLR